MALPYNIRQDSRYNPEHIMSDMEYTRYRSYQAYTTAQRELLSTTKGMIVYDTDYKNLFHYNGTSWVEA